MQEILKQPQYQPMSMEHQVVAIFAGTNGFADAVSTTHMAQWQADMIAYMEASYPEVVRDIAEKKAITDANRANLLKALDAFRSSWQA